jgi:tetratricopeptide (TPR) repeat protein
MSRGDATRYWPVVAGLTLAAVALAAHGLGLFSPFQYDDKPEILLNPNMAGLGQWRELWIYNPSRFLLLCTFALQYNSTGLETWPFHGLNLVIHGVNSALVAALAFRVLRLDGREADRATRIAALFAGLLFAAHPLLVEGVTYISGRSSSLATTVYLACLWLFDDILRRQRGAADQGARFRAVSRRVSLLLSLVIGVASVGAATGAVLSRLEMVPAGRALFLGLGATLLACGAAAAPVRRILAIPLPAGPPATPLVVRWAVLTGLFVIGAMTKEIVVTLPAALWLWELTMYRRGALRPALRSLVGFHLPFFVGPLALLLFRWAYYGALFSPDMLRSPWINLWTETEVVWRYVGLFLWPGDLSVFHHHREALGPLTWPTIAAVALWIAVAVWAVRSLRRHPALVFLVVWPLVALSPTSSILPLKEAMAEHRAYLPAAAWCIVPVLLAMRTAIDRRALAVLGALWVLALGGRCAVYTQQWNSEEGLWLHAVELNPDAAPAWYMLGDIARATARLDDAETFYGRCLEADPGYADAANNLGLIHAERRDLDGALRLFEQADRIAGEQGTCNAPALNNMANVHALREDSLEASRLFDDALQCDPDNCVAHVGLGHLFYGPLENRDLALEHYRSAVSLCPNHPTILQLTRQIEELSW